MTGLLAALYFETSKLNSKRGVFFWESDDMSFDCSAAIWYDESD